MEKCKQNVLQHLRKKCLQSKPGSIYAAQK
jgi:hypothetical protein